MLHLPLLYSDVTRAALLPVTGMTVTGMTVTGMTSQILIPKTVFRKNFSAKYIR